VMKCILGVVAPEGSRIADAMLMLLIGNIGSGRRKQVQILPTRLAVELGLLSTHTAWEVGRDVPGLLA